MNAGLPYIRYVPNVRCPAQSARAIYVLAYPWGAPRLRAVAFSSLPACPPSPLAAVNLLPTCNATTARARTNALTLIPRRLACGFQLPIRSPAARSPRSALLIAARVPLFPARRGSCFLRSRSHRHVANAHAPYVQVSDGRASRVPSSVQPTRFYEKRILKTVMKNL